MKFQVSVLSDKGVKKVVATVEADRFEEITKIEDKLLFSLQTRVKFWLNKSEFWGDKVLVASLFLNGSYVVEEVV